MTSSQTDFNTKHQSEKYLKEQRKQIGTLGNKPHNLKDQNEVIKRMLDRGKDTITSGDPLLATGEFRDSIGGTPKIPRKTVPRRGNS